MSFIKANVILLFVILTSCTMTEFPYNFNDPTRVVELPEILNEISGLEYVSKNLLACVQDETATIFYISPKTGEIIDSIVFGKKGDYEGIVSHKKKFYVLRSDGRISRVSDKGVVKNFDFKKSKGFDFEGLCLDQENNRLLVACKEHGKKKKFIYIYAFSLDSKKYLKKPVFEVSRELVGKVFQPSGVAMHPDGTIYIPSAYSKQLLQISKHGKVLEVIELTNENFFQAEGICFGDSGKLYIANEKANGTPNVMTFKMKK